MGNSIHFPTGVNPGNARAGLVRLTNGSNSPECDSVSGRANVAAGRYQRRRPLAGEFWGGFWQHVRVGSGKLIGQVTRMEITR